MLVDYKQLSVTTSCAGSSLRKWTAISRSRFHRYGKYPFVGFTASALGSWAGQRRLRALTDW